MGFWSLFVVASMPNLQFLLVGLVGAILATGYVNILSTDARRYMNKIVFVVFAPSLVFSSLARSVTLHDLISWWFMPVNIALTFLIGGALGWVVVKILRPERHLEGIVIANCSAGNLGNMLLIIIPAICDEHGNPFGDSSMCNTRGLSYVSLSMALGGLFIWTHTYSLIYKSSVLRDKSRSNNGSSATTYKDSVTDGQARHHDVQKEAYSDQEALLQPSTKPVESDSEQTNVPLLSCETISDNNMHFWGKLKRTLHQSIEELLSPPFVAAIVGFIVGVVPGLKSLIIGPAAPLRVIEDSVTLLGDGSVPCMTLILGGNLIKGIRKSAVKPMVVIAIICVRYLILPICGIAVVKAAGELGFLPQSPLFHFVLLIQFALPPAMAIGIIAQLFNVGQEECSVIFLWTYLAAALALTFWSTVFMWILS